MYDRLLVVGILDHLDEGGGTRIFRDEAEIPLFVFGPDQHQPEIARPGDPTADTPEDRPAFQPVGSVSLRAAGLPTVRIGRPVTQADEVEHVHRPVVGQRPERTEPLACRIDMAVHGTSLRGCYRDSIQLIVSRQSLIRIGVPCDPLSTRTNIAG